MRFNKNIPTACAAAVAIVGLASPLRAAPPEVVVTVAPVHSLVAAIMKGVGSPKLLIPASASPHVYSLRPSDARALSNADIVFWVGPDMETFLKKPLESLADGKIVAFSSAPGITQQGARTAADHDDHDDHKEEARGHDDHDDHDDHKEEARGHDDHAGHDHAGDPHIWLGIANARRIADMAAVTLRRQDPENTATYGDNLMRLRARLTELERSLRDRLKPVAQRPYVVMHDAYRHLEAEFDLRSVGAISLSPDRRPGARRLSEIRELIADAKVRCVFSEPQFSPAIARTVVEGTNARLGQLDPVGADIPPGPDQYFILMENLSQSLVDCLSG